MSLDIPAIAIEYKAEFELALGLSFPPGLVVPQQILVAVEESIKDLLVSLNYITAESAARRRKPILAVSVPITPTPKKKRRPTPSPAPFSPPPIRRRIESTPPTAGRPTSQGRIESNTLKLECLRKLELRQLALIEYGVGLRLRNPEESTRNGFATQDTSI